MQNDILDFYSNIISPFVREFEENRDNLKSAFGAAWALDSYASHIYFHFKKAAKLANSGDEKYKNNILANQSVDFKLISHVSAATKHSVRSRPNISEIYTSADLSSENLEGWSAYFAGPDADDWGQQVIITNDKHFFKPLLPIVLRAESFLVDHCASLQRSI